MCVSEALRAATRGQSARMQGDLDTAECCYLSALDFSWKTGEDDAPLFGRVCNSLSLVYRDMALKGLAELDLAAKVSDRAVSIAAPSGGLDLASALLNRAGISLLQGALADAQTYARRALQCAPDGFRSQVLAFLEQF
jgi:tetratricopeptide (TPR) repeat protein